MSMLGYGTFTPLVFLPVALADRHNFLLLPNFLSESSRLQSNNLLESEFFATAVLDHVLIRGSHFSSGKPAPN